PERGLLGTLLATCGLAGALAAGWRAVRGARGGEALAGDVAIAALGGFAYWLVHGSFDWFFEFAGLGAPAFALLGLACALAPAQRGEPRSRAERGSRTGTGARPARARRAVLSALGAAAALA